MNKNLSKVLAVVAFLGLGMLTMHSAVAQSVIVEIFDAASGTFKIPLSANKLPDTSRRWSRPSFFSVGGNTSCGLAYAGKGIVTGVSGMGQASDGIRVYDAASVGSLTYATLDTTKLILNVSIDTAKQSGQFEYDGVPFVSGAVVCPASPTAYGSVRFIKQQ